MFQLIVAVISVALVAAIALAVLWFGGSGFFTGTDKAHYAQYMNHGSQIEAALQLYRNENGDVPTGDSSQIVAQLVKGDQSNTYLNSSPQGTWFVDSGTIYRSLTREDECKRINVVAKGQEAVDALGGDGCPACIDKDYADWPGCRKDAYAVAPTP